MSFLEAHFVVCVGTSLFPETKNTFMIARALLVTVICPTGFNVVPHVFPVILRCPHYIQIIPHQPIYEIPLFYESEIILRVSANI